MAQLKTVSLTLSALTALALTQAACSPVSPSEAKGSKTASGVTLSSQTVSLSDSSASLKTKATGNPNQMVGAQILSDEKTVFLTQEQFEMLESGAKNNFYISELADNSLGALKKDSYVTVDMYDLSLTPKILEKKSVRAFAVLDASTNAQTVASLNDRYAVKFADQKTGPYKTHGELVIAFVNKDSPDVGDPAKDVDISNALNEFVRKVIFVVK